MSPYQFKIVLNDLDPKAVDFPILVDDLLNRVDLTDHDTVTDVIFDFSEKYPDEELGMPGSLVHFIEKSYPAYKTRLLQSLVDAPNVSAVLMVNRILNSTLTPGERAQYLMALGAVFAGGHASPETRKSALAFLEYQRQRDRPSA
jgi:hypothetical protein